jgi:hypothetical protein
MSRVSATVLLVLFVVLLWLPAVDVRALISSSWLPLRLLCSVVLCCDVL